MIKIAAALILAACTPADSVDIVDAAPTILAERPKLHGVIVSCDPTSRRWAVWLGQYCMIEDCCKFSTVPITLVCYSQTVSNVDCVHR